MSQQDAILEALKRGETLTPKDALERFGCFRLAARVRDLREQGHLIETVPMGTRSARFAGYRLLYQPELGVEFTEMLMALEPSESSR